MHNTREIINAIKFKEMDVNDHKSIRELFLPNQINDKNLSIILDAVKNKDLYLICDLKYFLTWIFMPTLCFQLSFPRNDKIRKFWLFKRCFELLVCSLLSTFIFAQYSMPILDSTLHIYKLKGIASFEIIGKILKLAVPNAVVWVLFFFNTFQFYTNILAEITYFADREFYKEWWNCRN